MQQWSISDELFCFSYSLIKSQSIVQTIGELAFKNILRCINSTRIVVLVIMGVHWIAIAWCSNERIASSTALHRKRTFLPIFTNGIFFSFIH
jgi:hypothetical protein